MDHNQRMCAGHAVLIKRPRIVHVGDSLGCGVHDLPTRTADASERRGELAPGEVLVKVLVEIPHWNRRGMKLPFNAGFLISCRESVGVALKGVFDSCNLHTRLAIILSLVTPPVSIPIAPNSTLLAELAIGVEGLWTLGHSGAIAHEGVSKHPEWNLGRFIGHDCDVSSNTANRRCTAE